MVICLKIHVCSKNVWICFSYDFKQPYVVYTAQEKSVYRLQQYLINISSFILYCLFIRERTAPKCSQSIFLKGYYFITKTKSVLPHHRFTSKQIMYMIRIH